MTETAPLRMCPMAKTCQGMMEKPSAGLWIVIPGAVFIALGIAIIIFPQILAWLVAIALIVTGFVMLMMVNFMRSFGKRMQYKHG
ncbi:MAG: hypothetical protein OER97_04725 [Gammaproteobacteria bacterium]|nr:hypothetical protein [Gammaproteobacteria bacterium]